MRRRMIVLAAAVVVLASLGGAALGYERGRRSTEPNAKGVITACYDTSTGKPRMVNAGARCAAGEKKLTWQQHPQRPVVHEVGAPGQPPYVGIFKAYDGPPFGNASFYKDSFGIVHLTGLFCGSNGGVCGSGSLGSGARAVFTLPPRFRPSHEQVFTALSYSGTSYGSSRSDVMTSGVVELVVPPDVGARWQSLDGISFLAG